MNNYVKLLEETLLESRSLKSKSFDAITKQDLKKGHTKELLNLKKQLYSAGKGINDTNEDQKVVDTLMKMVKDELATRGHVITSKQDNKKIRQYMAKNKVSREVAIVQLGMW